MTARRHFVSRSILILFSAALACAPAARSADADDTTILVANPRVDRIIASESDKARFFAGIVAWRPGELNEELKRGMWYAPEPDAKLVFRKQTKGMWEELVHNSELSRNAI